MKILCIGDVTGQGGVKLLASKLWKFRKENKIDFCIVNAENAGFITGASPEAAEALFSAGADVLTGGNHTLKNKSIYTYIDEHEYMLRPLNFSEDAPGQGYCIADAMGYRVLVISVMGNVHIEPTLDAPYSYIERVLRREEGRYDFAIMDVHAEATGEKLAIAHVFDGKISIIYGTHTHVPTADMQILPRGTGYVTDLGMCGETGGILGMEADSVIKKMRTHLPHSFRVADGPTEADGVIFDLSTSDFKVKDVRRIKIR